MRAVVQTPVCPLMTSPAPEGVLADEALLGMTVEALERAGPGWWRVRAPYRYEGYAPARCLAWGERTARAWEAGVKKRVLHKNFCDVLSEPRFQSRRLTTLPLGAVAAVTGEAWEGWQRVSLPDGREGWVRAGWLEDGPTPPSELAEGALRQRLAEAALRYRNAPYRWGGKTPRGVDCSGLVFMAYWLNGVVIYRDAEPRPGFDLAEIPREELGVGDLLFFPGHVAMYLGEGRYLHATGRAGSDGVAIHSLDPADPLYRPDLAGSVTRVGSYRGFHSK